MEEIFSFGTSVFTRTTRRHIQEHGILAFILFHTVFRRIPREVFILSPPVHSMQLLTSSTAEELPEIIHKWSNCLGQSSSKPIIRKFIKKFSAFHEIRKFITVLKMGIKTGHEMSCHKPRECRPHLLPLFLKEPILFLLQS
jgi:hypothetical protein